MSVLSVICLASLRKAELDNQEGFVPGEDEWICAECGFDDPDNREGNSCQG